MIEARNLTKRYGSTVAVDALSFDVRPGSVTGFLGPERVGQVHHDAADPRAGPARRRPGAHRRPPLPRAALAAARGRRAARGQGVPPGPQRPQSPGRAGGQQRDSAGPGRRGARHGRPDQRGRAAGRQVLPRHGAAPGRRRGAAGRPGGAAAGRAGERAGPRGRPLDPQPAEVAGRAGPHRVRVQPPDQRDGADRRPAGGDRPGPAARGHDRRRAVGRVGVAGGRVLPAHQRSGRVPRSTTKEATS